MAVDFIDRYLSVQINIQKSQLQLIGVTCLFIAAKLEVSLIFIYENRIFANLLRIPYMYMCRGTADSVK